MKNKIIAVITIVLALTGCGKSDELGVSNVPEVEQSVQVSGEVKEYNLKPVEVGNVEDTNDEIEKFPSQGVQSVINEPVNTDADSQSDDSNSQYEEIPISSADANINDIISSIKMPDDYIIELKFGAPGMPAVGMLYGTCGDYKMNGTSECFMWESDGGTFYNGSDGVKSVSVNGRSILFSGSNEEYSDDSGMYMDTGIGISTNDLSTEEFIEALNEGSPYYSGTAKFNNVDCHVITFSTTDETGEEQEAQIYIGIADNIIYGMYADAADMTVEAYINDYKSCLSDLEETVSGTIDDETASNSVNESLMSSIFGFIAGAIAAGSEE